LRWVLKRAGVAENRHAFIYHVLEEEQLAKLLLIKTWIFRQLFGAFSGIYISD